MAAAYECSISMTDDETLLFNIKPQTSAGAAPTWADYTFEYALTGNGITLLLTETDGIEVDDTNDILTIGPADRAYRLAAGEYKHGLRMTTVSGDITTQLFDGTVTVTEGNFAA